MNREPVVSIGVVFTSLKVAVVSLLTVVAISLQLDEATTGAIIGAGSAITLAIGDIVAYALTRPTVTPVDSPNLPVGTIVNAHSDAPTSVVAPSDPQGMKE